jgi:hypothetical protein
MSLVTDILDRLSGVAVVKTELAHTVQRIDKLGEVVFNHETRIARLERTLALSSVYNALHRHGWRKLAPDQRHPQSDAAAQAEWKETSPPRLPPSTGSGSGRAG